MKAPLSTWTGEDGRGHVCVTELFLWLNTLKHAERGQDICMRQHGVNSTRLPGRILPCPGQCQSSEVALHVPEETSLMVALVCLKNYWDKA